MGTLQMTVVVPLLPGLERLLGVTPTTASWALTAGLLSGAVSIPLLSRLGDMYGRRPVSLVALGLLVAGPLMRRFTASSLVAAGSLLVAVAALWLAVSRSSGADLYGAATVLGLGVGLG
uniref:Membrane transport protein n=1 Tax=Nonomuraea gerenzanensis TaxID=93944 RepID=A0A1M4EKZ1_9ACTN|nr:membrane transport protein [Nonomuraea gerenzanensis]